jgi:hypothetical protein
MDGAVDRICRALPGRRRERRFHGNGESIDTTGKTDGVGHARAPGCMCDDPHTKVDPGACAF